MGRAGGLVARAFSRLVQVAILLISLSLVAVMVLGAIVTQRGWPQTSGTIALAGLHQQTQVVRDGNGILQITADDVHDLFMAQGYAHAQERMWQMEISRRIGAGRLSERQVHPHPRLARRCRTRPRGDVRRHESHPRGLFRGRERLDR
jgi:hypothetical protein